MSKFKIGPAKTRDGTEAVIYAFHEGQDLPIHGAIKQIKSWRLASWRSDGKLYGDADTISDLLPNVEPEKWEWVGSFNMGSPQDVPREKFQGKKVKITVEEVLE